MSDYINSIQATESKWIEVESINYVRKAVNGNTIPAILAISILLTFLFPRLEIKLWLSWVTIHVLIFIIRYLYFSSIKKNIKFIVKFYKYYLAVVAVVGYVWGATVYLLMRPDQTRAEAIGLCIILMYGIATTINLSRHLHSLYTFLMSYGVGIVSALLWYVYANFAKENIFEDFLLIVFVGLLVFILYKFGKQMNFTSNSALSLQYRNNLLIESLKIEKQVAIDAVEIKNRFMASAAHDMRQPVLALDLYTDMLVDDPEALPIILPKIAGATKSVIVMFDALFDLARISMNQMTPEKTYFNIQDMIEDLSMQFQPIAKAKGLHLRVRSYPILCGVKDDPILLKRIFSNLLSNAVKYTDHGGILLAFRHSERRGTRIEVWDTGLGISPDKQEAVFSEFYKNPENAGTTDGFGLGLAIVAQLCGLLGHSLTMKSRRGRGTVISVRLSDAALIA